MAGKNIWIVIVLLFISSCANRNKEEKTIEAIIDDAIQQYDTINFDKYYNLEILVRERRYIRDAIILSTVSYDPELFPKNLDMPPSWECLIEKFPFGIILITEKDWVDERNKGYLSKKQIRKIFRDFDKYDLDYLKVDYNDNVFLSPIPFSFERPFLLRVNDSTIVKENKHLRSKNLGGHFTNYKGSWYLSDFYIHKYNISIEL